MKRLALLLALVPAIALAAPPTASLSWTAPTADASFSISLVPGRRRDLLLLIATI